MADRNQVAFSHENTRLAIGDLVSFKVRSFHHDEKLVAIDVDFGDLSSGKGVLHGKGMQPEHLLEGRKLILGGGRQANPCELARTGFIPDLREWNLLNAVAVTVEMRCYNAHVRPIEIGKPDPERDVIGPLIIGKAHILEF